MATDPDTAEPFNEELAETTQLEERETGGPASAGYESLGGWSSSSSYQYGDIITRSGEDFQCTEQGTSADPLLDTTAWRPLGTNLTQWGTGRYLYNTAYPMNSLVLKDGVCYTVLGAGGAVAGDVPGQPGSAWSVYVPPVWNSANAYARGNFVDQGGVLYIALAHSATGGSAPASNNDYWYAPTYNGSQISVT